MDFSEVIGQRNEAAAAENGKRQARPACFTFLWTLRFRQNGFGDELRKLFA